MWRAIFLTAFACGVQGRPNKVRDVTTSCDKGSIIINLDMEKPFKGLVFSKEFSRECHVLGQMQTNVTLHLPSNACGVRTSTLNDTIQESDKQESLYYTVELIVQMDKMLQQSSDQEIIVKCKLQPRAVRINSSALEGVIKSRLREITGHDGKRIRDCLTASQVIHFVDWYLPGPEDGLASWFGHVVYWCQDLFLNRVTSSNNRTGRNRKGWESVLEVEQLQLLEAARAWMKLAPAHVEVGQPTELVIHCTLPVGVGLRVTNCVAHDGMGEASQKLLDEAGCPIDETIFNSPTLHKHRGRGEIDFSEPHQSVDNFRETKTDSDYLLKNMMTYQHAVTTFAAFKFPDRAKLHLSCGIELCKGLCPRVDCKALKQPQHTKDGLVRKARLDKDAKGLVIERLEVYNSIEVLAPNIELEDEASIRGSRRVEGEEDLLKGFSPGDKTICLSPGKMALAFCVLGIIFLCAIAVAFASLVRARQRTPGEPVHTSLSFYTGSKSMFSSSDSSSSGLSGSKLLLTDSPYLDHHSSSSHMWPYTRAF